MENQLRYYHVTELVGSRTPRYKLPDEVNKNLDAGSWIHEELAKLHIKLPGRFCEQTQINFLYEDTGKESRILGFIVGTPNMFWISKGVLYVIDYKTTTVANFKVTKAIWNQLSFYAVMILNNYCGGMAPYISKVVLEVWVYGRKRTVLASVKNLLRVEKVEAQAPNLLKGVLQHIQLKLLRPMLLAPASRGYIL